MTGFLEALCGQEGESTNRECEICGRPLTRSQQRHHNRFCGNGCRAQAQSRMRPIRERLLEKVRVDEASGCWLWEGWTDRGGYGSIRLGRNRKTHRVAYELFIGPIPEGLTIDHLCRTRACCNPAHLEAVTMGVNVLRGTAVTAQNARKTHCHRGHPFDEVNTYRTAAGYRECRTCGRERRAQRARVAT